MNRKEKSFFYIKYTAFFLLFSSFIVFFYYSQGKSMISAGGDGFRQHYRALLYYSKILKQLFSSPLRIPQWDFVIGEGSDILRTLHYYCVGDIFTFFSFMCPEKYMYIYYDLATLARMYFSGLVFSILCFYRNKNNSLIVLLGSLLYAFSSYSIVCMTGHVFFISSAVYLPLIVLGVEKIINNDKPYLFTIAVTLSAMSNIYFFYMNVFTTIIFVAVRLLFINKDFKDRIKVFVNIAMYSVLGLLMASVVFLPMLNTMISNTRLSASVTYDLIFPLSDYIDMFKNMTFDDGYIGGYSVFWIISFSALFLKKRNKTLSVLLILVILFICIPSLSAMFNAMTYPTNRWGYAASLLIYYITVDILDDFESIQELFVVNLVFIVAYYIMCAYVDKENWKLHVLFLLVSVFTIVAIKLCNKRSVQTLICFLVVIFSLSFKMYYTFGPRYWNLASQGKDIKELHSIDNSEHSVFDSLIDNTFYRYSGNSILENESLGGKHSTTQFYWSIANDYVVDFRKQLGYSDRSIHHYDNYDDRFAQNALSSVKYYINNKSDVIPFGFDELNIIRGFDIYCSRYSLPLIYVYDNYLSVDTWNNLDLLQKNESLVQAAIINKEIDSITKKPVIYDHIEVPYFLKNNSDIVISDSRIEVDGQNPRLSITCDSDDVGEYYVVIEGLYSNILTAYIGIDYKDIHKHLVFKGTDNQHYTDRHDFIVNLGYLEGINGTIELDFSDGGNYEYKSLRIVCQPLEYQIDCIDRLRDIDINNIDVRNNNVYANVSIPENKIALFSIPYSKGWRAYVDGKKTELLNCNIQYMGLELEKGNHIIELRYSTPLLKEGAIISFIGYIFFASIIVRRKNKKS